MGATVVVGERDGENAPSITAALTDAQAARAGAERARDEAIAAINTMFAVGTRAQAQTLEMPDSWQSVRTTGYATGNDQGGAVYCRVASEPPHAGKFRSADRYLPGNTGTTSDADGGWWELPLTDIWAQMFGVVFDSSTINDQALQDAYDYLDYRGGGSIFYPPSTYFCRIEQFRVVQSNIKSFGGGWLSHVRNTRTIEDAGKSGQARAFDYGNMQRDAFEAFLSHNVNAITAGSNFVQCQTVGHVDNYAVGEIIWVRTAETSRTICLRLEIRKIIGIESATGKIFVDRTFPDAIAGAQPKISKCREEDDVKDAFGTHRRITQNVEFSGMRISTAKPNAGWDAAGGCYESLFERLWLESYSPIYSNAFVHCTFRTIWGTFANRIVEFGGYAADNVIEDLKVYFQDRGITPSGEPLIAFNENSNRNRMTGFEVHADDCLEGYLWRGIYGSDNIVEDGKCYVRGLTGWILGVRPSSGQECVRNTIRSLEIWANGQRHLSCDANEDATEGYNKFEEITFHGTPAGQGASAISLDRCNSPILRQIYTDSGKVEILPGCVSPTMNGIYTNDARMDLAQTKTHTVQRAANNGSGAIRISVDGGHTYYSSNFLDVWSVGGVAAATGNWRIDVITKTVSNIVASGAGKIRMTVTGHGRVTGDKIRITGVTGTDVASVDVLAAAVNGDDRVVTVVDANTLDLAAIDYPAGGATYVSGGEFRSDFDLVGSTWGSSSYTSGGSARWRAIGDFQNFRSPAVFSLLGLARVITGEPAITSTDSANVAFQATIPAASTIAGDQIPFKVDATPTGTAGEKYVKLYLGPVTNPTAYLLAELEFAQTDNNILGTIDGVLVITSATAQKRFLYDLKLNEYFKRARWVDTVNSDTDDLKMTLIAYNEVSGDTITFDKIEVGAVYGRGREGVLP